MRRKVMVTAGGTREYIDDVRVVTNISSGALGCKIAEAFLENGAHVFYVHSKGAPMPVILEDGLSRLTTEQFVTTGDLMDTMGSFCKGMGMDVVVHSAAVSDFTFRRDVPVKVSSDSEEGFIEHLRQAIVRTPKIVKSVKQWCPGCTLVSFKFTVGKSRDDLLNIAWHAGRGCGADFVVANDKEEMKRNRSHTAYLVNVREEPLDFDGGKCGHFFRMEDKDQIAKLLVKASHGFLTGGVGTRFRLTEKGAK